MSRTRDTNPQRGECTPQAQGAVCSQATVEAEPRGGSQKRKDPKSKRWERDRVEGQKGDKDGGWGGPARKTALPPQTQGAGGDSEGGGFGGRESDGTPALQLCPHWSRNKDRGARARLKVGAGPKGAH